MFVLFIVLFSESAAEEQSTPERKRPLMGGALFPIDLNSELKSRLKKSGHASVSNLKTTVPAAGDTLAATGNHLNLRNTTTGSASSSDTEEGKDLGKLLRSFSKDVNQSSSSPSSSSTPANKVKDVLTNISKTLSTVSTVPLTDNAQSASDGESSGGREVKTIIKNSAVARRKKQNDW